MKIVACTLAINDWYRDIVKYSIKNLETYCNNNDYDCVVHTENSEETVYDNTRSPCWYKIKLIQKILKEKECDYVFWMDIDCQILKHDLKLEYFIEKYFNDPEVDLVLTQDNNILNTGVMFVKKTDFIINLMDRIWDNPADDYFADFHEQTSLANLYSADEDIKKHVKILPYGVKDELVVFWGNYYPGKNFLLHSARCTHDRLGFMFMMDSYYPFKIDEENEDEYQDRINWLNDEKLCRDEIDRLLRKEYVPRRYSARCKKIFNVG